MMIILRFKIILFLPIMFLVSNCSKKTADLETQLVKRDNIFFEKNHKKPYNGLTYSFYSNNKKKNKW